MDNTIYSESNIGKRLSRIKKSEIMKLSYAGEYIPLIGTIKVGREKGNDILIGDNLASRFHAIIQKIKDSYFIKDLNSTNGTYVNNEMVPKEKYIKLKKNDVIKIGRTEIIIR